MKRATIRELKHEMTKVLALVEAGETVELTRNNKPVAIISPLPVEKPVLPDFLGRMRAIYGDRVMPTTAVEIMDYDRGDR